MIRPAFYMVGAPRCGTTWLHQNLRDHPGVFMPRYKDIGLFCPDVGYRPADREVVGTQLDEFERLFADAPPGAMPGTACTEDLFSAVAADHIHAMNPDARIIVQLREPVEAMYSLWSLRTTSHAEHRTLMDAMTANEREASSASGPTRFSHWYLPLYRYGEQLPRYLDRFDRRNVHVMVFDDFIRDPATAYRGVLDFLGLEPTAPRSISAANPNVMVRSRAAERVIFGRSTVAAAKRIVPHRFHDRARRVAEGVNGHLRRPTERPPMDPELRAQLVERFRPEVRRAGDLIGRDLETLWYGP